MSYQCFSQKCESSLGGSLIWGSSSPQPTCREVNSHVVLIKLFPLAVPLTDCGKVMGSEPMEGCLHSARTVGWGCIFWHCFFPWMFCQSISAWIHWDQICHVREKFLFQAGLIIDLFTELQFLVTVVEKLLRKACM